MISVSNISINPDWSLSVWNRFAVLSFAFYQNICEHVKNFNEKKSTIATVDVWCLELGAWSFNL